MRFYKLCFLYLIPNSWSHPYYFFLSLPQGSHLLQILTQKTLFHRASPSYTIYIAIILKYWWKSVTISSLWMYFEPYQSSQFEWFFCYELIFLLGNPLSMGISESTALICLNCTHLSNRKKVESGFFLLPMQSRVCDQICVHSVFKILASVKPGTKIHWFQLLQFNYWGDDHLGQSASD